MHTSSGQSPRNELERLREELLRRIVKNEQRRKQHSEVAAK